MTLLITVFAAVISTVVWYLTAQKIDLKLGTLCFLFWGASIMWSVDSVYEYASLGTEYFNPDVESMLNDAFFGLSAVALALVIWITRLLLSDPLGVIADMLTKNGSGSRKKSDKNQ